MIVAHRRIFYSFVVLLFFVLAFSIIQYASGYRYDLTRRSWVKVGALYIKSYPSGAEVFIDGKPTGKKTPARVLTMLPSEHSVTVVRPGFKPWSKRLTITSGDTIFVRDIVLFKETPPVIQLSTGGTNSLVAADRAVYVFLGSDGRIHLTNTDGPTDFIIPTSIVPDRLLALSPQRSALALARDAGLYVLDLNSEVLTKLPLPPGFTVRRAQWDPNSDALLWLLNGDRRLARFDRSTGELKINPEPADDFYLTSKGITTIRFAEGRLTVQSAPTLAATPISIHSLTTAREFKIQTVLDNGAIVLSDPIGTWIVMEGHDAPRMFELPIVSAHGTELLLAGDFEVTLFDTESWSDVLIDRSSQKLQQALWHPSGSYVLLQREHEVDMLELDSRDARNYVPITGTTPTSSITFDNKGSKLFVTTPTANTYVKIQ